MRGQIIEKTKGVFLVRVQKRNGAHRQSFSRTVEGNRSAANKMLTRMLGELDSGRIADAAKQSLNSYLDMWLETTAKPRLHPRTYGDYGDLLRLHVREPLGHLRLSDVKAVHIQKLYADLQIVKGLSPRRVRYVHAVLSSALKNAVNLDLLTRNVAKQVTLPKQARKEMKVLTEEECHRFLLALSKERQGAMFSLALTTGMRPEEYLGLQWQDVDLAAKVIQVRRAVVRLPRTGWSFSELKTKASSRSIPIPAALAVELQLHRRRQNEERMKLGPAWSNYDLVFPSEVGTPPTHSNITQIFKRILRAAGIGSDVRLYDLRHTHATLLLNANVHPKVVSERLGHATISLTLDVYSHVLPTMQAQAVEQLEAILFGEKAA